MVTTAERQLEPAIRDLLHDLGKHVALPVNLLPRAIREGKARTEADLSKFVAALDRGLAGDGLAARAWCDFEQGFAAFLGHSEAFATLRQRVARAFRHSDCCAMAAGRWEPVLDVARVNLIVEDVRAVAPAIRALLAAVAANAQTGSGGLSPRVGP